MDDRDFQKLRRKMVDMQIVNRGVIDPSTINSLKNVPRHLFVPNKFKNQAYEDFPIPIGDGQTISQPFLVALMTQEAKCNQNSVVLDIGTGSGYAAAIFSRFVKDVYSIERITLLAEQAKERFTSLGYDNIHVKIGDGTLGWKEHAPYDAIVVTAGAPVVPSDLIEQLAIGGYLIIPVGGADVQHLMRYHKVDDQNITEETLDQVRFVPLIGKKGWKEKK